MAVDLDATELAEPVRTAENTALVLIDFQRDFCEAGGYADTIDDIGFAREVVPRALRLLHAARERSLTIVHTREGYAPDLSDCSLQRRLRSARGGAPIGSVGPLGRLLIRGEFGHDFISELTPEASELVIDKPSYGAFTHTSLEPELRRLGIVHLYFAGVTADVCVHTTVREATDRGFFCHYVRDAISTFDPALRVACERMVDVEGGIWGRLTDVHEALGELEVLR
ncbi:MAG: cysteine hydrolase [Mycobacterium sp.]|jgi:nicotinamidase-related amidase|nr:cysteine hydrolase [Mycobacterium sp.]